MKELSPHTKSNLTTEIKRAAPFTRTALKETVIPLQLSATDILAPTTMKNAAKCDTSCDLQNPVNHQIFERTLRFWVCPGACLSECLKETAHARCLLHLKLAASVEFELL